MRTAAMAMRPSFWDMGSAPFVEHGPNLVGGSGK